MQQRLHTQTALYVIIKHQHEIKFSHEITERNIIVKIYKTYNFSGVQSLIETGNYQISH